MSSMYENHYVPGHFSQLTGVPINRTRQYLFCSNYSSIILYGVIMVLLQELCRRFEENASRF